MKEYPWVLIKTSGEDVGLPVGVMGNSEVGHRNIGAGRIVDQETVRISRRIQDESFFTNPTLVKTFAMRRKWVEYCMFWGCARMGGCIQTRNMRMRF